MSILSQIFLKDDDASHYIVNGQSVDEDWFVFKN